MKTSISKQRSTAAFTVGEMMVGLGIAAVVGTGAAYLLLNGTILYAKNTAENLAHDENRIAVNRLVRDIHSAVSTPQLGKMMPGNLAANPTAPVGSWTPYGTNVTFWAEPGTGPTSGISFKRMGSATNPNGGPFEVINDPGNKDLIQINSGTANPPFVGTEIIFPYYGMEGTVNQVTSNGNHHFNIWVNGGLESRIKKKKDTSVICYYMTRYAYVVENGELRFYASTPPPAGVTWPVVVARNMVQPPGTPPTATVKVRESSYSPATVSIYPGETVQWDWEDDDNRVKSKSPHPPSGSFHSGGGMEEGDSFSWTFKDIGTWNYDDNGSSPNGTVIVKNWESTKQNVRPFSQTNPDYVAINLTTEDNRFSNRNFRAVNTLLAGSVPIRAKISKTQ